MLSLTFKINIMKKPKKHKVASAQTFEIKNYKSKETQSLTFAGVSNMVDIETGKTKEIVHSEGVTAKSLIKVLIKRLDELHKLNPKHDGYRLAKDRKSVV